MKEDPRLVQKRKNKAVVKQWQETGEKNSSVIARHMNMSPSTVQKYVLELKEESQPGWKPKPKRPRNNEELRNQIKYWYEKRGEKNYSEIARKLRVSASTVSQNARTMADGRDRPYKAVRPRSTLFKRIRPLAEKGLSSKEISKILNVQYDTVRLAQKKNDYINKADLVMSRAPNGSDASKFMDKEIERIQLAFQLLEDSFDPDELDPANKERWVESWRDIRKKASKFISRSERLENNDETEIQSSNTDN